MPRGRKPNDDVPTEFQEGYYDESVFYKPDTDGQLIVDDHMRAVLTDEPQFPKHWQRNMPKVVEAALVFGLIHLGWTVKDYIINAIQQGGFELIIIWGVQGSGKSNRLMQILNWVHNDWDLVLERMEFTPRGFIKRLKELPDGKRLPILGWDDLTVHMTSSSYKFDPKLYSAIDSALAAIRTKCNVLIVTTPHIERVPANIRANCTMEIFLGRNQTMLTERICKLPNYYELKGFLTKVQIEPISRFNLFDVPYDIYTTYEDSRIGLADDSIDDLHQLVNVTEYDPENWVPILEAAEMANFAANTIHQYVKNKLVRQAEFNNTRYLWREDVIRLRDLPRGRRRKKKTTKKTEK